MSRSLNTEEITNQIADLVGWQLQAESIHRTYQFPDFPTAIGAVDRVALDAEAMNHHPDIDIRWRKVTFVLSTHSEGGLTQLDIELAHQIQRVARALSAS